MRGARPRRAVPEERLRPGDILPRLSPIGQDRRSGPRKVSSGPGCQSLLMLPRSPWCLVCAEHAGLGYPCFTAGVAGWAQPRPSSQAHGLLSATQRHPALRHQPLGDGFPTLMPSAGPQSPTAAPKAILPASAPRGLHLLLLHWHHLVRTLLIYQASIT